MISEKVSECDLTTQATAAVQEMLAQASAEKAMNFLEFCVAVETSLILLAENGCFCRDFSLTFDENRLEFEALAATAERPENFDLTDLSRTILMVCAPKQLHDTHSLVVRRAVLSYQNDPTVQYRIKTNAQSEQRKD
jgi:hypothetical protein